MARSYTFSPERFEEELKKGDVYMSDADIALGRRDPDAGMAIISGKREYAGATTDAEKSAINSKVEKVRLDRGGYTAGSDGSSYNLQSTPSSFTPSTAQPTWEDTYRDPYDELLDAQINREEFSYDYKDDPNYSALAKAYRREGDRATKNALAQASAQTGGVASSYATTAAAQAGNYYASQLSDKIPELFDAAYNRYLKEYQMDAAALDAVAAARQMDRAVYESDLNQWNINNKFDYGVHTDQIDYMDAQKQKTLENAMTAASYGDFSKLGALGIDTTKAEELYGYGVEGQRLDNELSALDVTGSTLANESAQLTYAINLASQGNFGALKELGADVETLEALWQANAEAALKMAGLELTAAELDIVNSYIAQGRFSELADLGVPAEVISRLSSEWNAIQSYNATVRNQEIAMNDYSLGEAAYNAAVNKYNTSGDATALDMYYGLEPGTTQKYFDAQAEAASAAEGESLTMDDINEIGGYAEDAKAEGRSPDAVVKSIVAGMGLTAQAMASVEQIVYGAYGYELVMVEIDANGDPIYAWKPKDAIKTADVTETEVNMWNNGRNYPRGH